MRGEKKGREKKRKEGKNILHPHTRDYFFLNKAKIQKSMLKNLRSGIRV